MALVKQIEALLEKYFDATASMQEEEIIRDYFNQDQIAPHLETYKPLFTYFKVAKEEVFTGEIPLKPRRNKKYLQWASIAAVGMLLFGTYFGNKAYEQHQAEQALAEAELAFDLLAQNFGKGTQSIQYLGDNFQKGTKGIAYLKTFEDSKNKILKP